MSYKKKELCGFSLQANYTDRAIPAGGGGGKNSNFELSFLTFMSI
jgi:hypothetical protein